MSVCPSVTSSGALCVGLSVSSLASSLWLFRSLGVCLLVCLSVLFSFWMFAFRCVCMSVCLFKPTRFPLSLIQTLFQLCRVSSQREKRGFSVFPFARHSQRIGVSIFLAQGLIWALSVWSSMDWDAYSSELGRRVNTVVPLSTLYLHHCQKQCFGKTSTSSSFTLLCHILQYSIFQTHFFPNMATPFKTSLVLSLHWRSSCVTRSRQQCEIQWNESRWYAGSPETFGTHVYIILDGGSVGDECSAALWKPIWWVSCRGRVAWAHTLKPRNPKLSPRNPKLNPNSTLGTPYMHILYINFLFVALALHSWFKRSTLDDELIIWVSGVVHILHMLNTHTHSYNQSNAPL